MANRNKTLIGSTTDSTDNPFKNLVLSAVSYTGPAGFQSALKESGMPKDGTLSIGGDITLQVNLPSNLTSSDTMVLAMPGTGAVTINRGSPGFTVTATGAGTTVVGSTANDLVVTGTNIYVEFNFVTSVTKNVTLRLPNGTAYSGAGIPIVCKKSDYAAIIAAVKPEDYFSDDYIALYQSLNFGTIRSMGWTNPNGGSPTSQFGYLAPWNASINTKSVRWVPGAWAGATTSGNNAYIANAPADISGTTPVDGELIQLSFTNALVGTNPTIQIGSRPAKALLDSHNFLNAISSISAGQTATLCYSRIMGAYIMYKGGQSLLIPYELQIGFANRLNADLWITVPFWFTDASITALATLVRNNLNSGLKAHFAYSNEVWNSGFDQTDWAHALGTAIGWSGSSDQNLHSWYGLRFCQMADLITAAWAPRTTTELGCTIEFQAFASTTPVDQFRLQGQKLNNAGATNYATFGFADYSTSGHRPIDKCDALSYATYYSGAQCTNFDANYLVTQTEVAVIGATSANPCVIQTSAAHGYTTGQRVELGHRSGLSSSTAFTGAWAALNQVAATVTVIDSTHFSVPIDTSAFAAYSANAGGVRRFNNEMTGLIAAADNYALGTPSSIATALSWLDNDVRAGTNYGVLGSQTSSALNSNIYPGWDTIASGYGKPVNCYEGGFEGWYPAGASCTTLGYNAATYGDATGRIAALITAYRNSTNFLRTVENQRNQFLAFGSSGIWAWLIVNAASQWSLQSGDIYTSKWKSFDAIALFNNNKSRLVAST